MLSERPSPSKLFAASVVLLYQGETTGDYAPFDRALFATQSARKLSIPSSVGDVNAQLDTIAEAFENERCSIPTESDIRNYKLFRQNLGGGIEEARFPIKPEQLESFADRVWSCMNEFQQLSLKAGRIISIPGLSRVFCGLLAYHVRYGAADAADLLPFAQHLQTSLTGRLSPAFQKSEIEWAGYTSKRLAQNEQAEAVLDECKSSVRGSHYDQLVDAMSRYTRIVHQTMASFLGAGGITDLKFSAVDAYKYAFLAGLIPESRWNSLVTSANGHIRVRSFDLDALKKGALAASRTLIEYATVQWLVPEGERASLSVKYAARWNPADTWGYAEPLLRDRSEKFETDYWNIAAPLLAARAFRVNPCQPLSLAYSADTTKPYLTGLTYLSRFVIRASTEEQTS